LVNQRRDHYQSALGSPTHCEHTYRSLGGLSARCLRAPGVRRGQPNSDFIVNL